MQVVQRLADELEGDCPTPLVVALTKALADALWQIYQQNESRIGKLRAEITLKRLPDGYQLIIRDDGKLLAVVCPDAEVVHLPVTGFNRNILTCRNI